MLVHIDALLLVHRGVHRETVARDRGAVVRACGDVGGFGFAFAFGLSENCVEVLDVLDGRSQGFNFGKLLSLSLG